MMLTEDYSPVQGYVYPKGTVGQLAKTEWPNENPTLLQFGNDLRDVFPDEVLVPCDMAMELSVPVDPYGSIRSVEEDKGKCTLLKLDRMYQIWLYLLQEADWVATPELYDVAGVPKTHLHLLTSRSHGGTSLESLDLIECEDKGSKPQLWRLTAYGKQNGYEVLSSLHPQSDEVMGG